MATTIRPEVSERNKYWIDKHRYYELKHFCLQYNEFKKTCALYNNAIIFTSKFNDIRSSNTPGDLTAKYAIRKAQYSERIKMIEQAAKDADEILYPFILKAVTEGLSFTHLKSRLGIPCGRDMYYDRYRRFFWLLNDLRN